ncbi:MAG TPA: biotin/lipoyl-containing protein, partial [Nocardioides sp.]
ATLDRIDEVHGRLTVDGHRYRLVTATHGPVHLVEVDDVMHRVSRDEGGMVRAPAPALVVSTPLAVGDEVTAGHPVLVLESMKMETALTAPFTGRVKELLVRVGSQVETAAPLLRLEPTGEAEGEATTATLADLDLPEPTTEPGRSNGALDDLSSLLLGYDVEDDQRPALLAAHLASRSTGAPADTLRVEMDLLALFTDFAELSRNRPAGDEPSTELRVHSSREYFHTYLRSLDPDRGALPDHFRDKLLRVLAHYGVSDLERTPELERAVFRIFLAQQHPSDVDVAIGVLQRWLGDPPPASEDAAAVRALLERMVRATQRRFAVVGDLARSVRFGWFDQALVDDERRAVLEGVPAEVAALTDPDAPDRAARIDALAAVPEPLVGFLRDRLVEGIPEREPLLEVLIRRHYRDYHLHDLTVTGIDDGGRPLAHAEYATDEKGATRVVSTIGDVTELARPDGPLGAAITSALSSDHDDVVEIYLRWTDAPADPDLASSELAKMLAGHEFARRARRVSIAVCHAAPQPIDYFTYRHHADGAPHTPTAELVEDSLVRGMHPMVGRRLNLWRLSEFDVTRLAAPDDVLLYECVARANPADRRLVAAAQARQLAVVRDDEGRVIALPHVERAVENCLEAIRRVRSARGREGTKLDVNHVWVTVWPVVEADLDQITALQSKITPLSEGAGIEEVLAQGRVAGRDGDAPTPLAIRFHAKPGAGVVADVIEPPTEPLAPMDDYAAKVLRARRRGLVYPYELQRALAGSGTVVEHDLDADGVLVPVDRAPGLNSAGIIVAVVTTPSALYPDGIARVVLCGDPLKSLGALSEPECARVIAAIDLAERMQIPVEWFAVSAGARISMESGTENMDWVAAALRRIVHFTQDGGEINIVVAGINVGAQP